METATREAERPLTFEAHRGLIAHVIDHYGYRGKGVDLEDLYQDGAVALLRALRCYRPGRGYPFALYAVYRIRQELTRVVRGRWRPVRVPRAVIVRVGRCIGALRAAAARGTPATPEAVVDALGLPARERRKVLAGLRVVTAEFRRLNFDVAEDRPAYDAELPDYRGAALSRRHRGVLHDYYVRGLTLAEIGRERGVSRQRVDFVRQDAIRKLRKFYHASA